MIQLQESQTLNERIIQKQMRKISSGLIHKIISHLRLRKENY